MLKYRLYSRGICLKQCSGGFVAVWGGFFFTELYIENDNELTPILDVECMSFQYECTNIPQDIQVLYTSMEVIKDG